MCELSIIIPFRDWGLDRLAFVVSAHKRELDALGFLAEVLVSDYGSEEADDVRALCDEIDVRWIRTERRGDWNRSDALNAALRESFGRVVVTTDADVLFAPACYERVYGAVRENPSALYLVQCRDLPASLDLGSLVATWEDRSVDWWMHLEKSSTIRPRWGMGGLMAFSRQRFLELNGYDERMSVWGAEDADLALRFNRMGYPTRWLSNSSTRIYHIWHESSQDKALMTSDAETVGRNRHLYRTDESAIRNLPFSLNVVRSEPLVSVVIPTYRRSYLLADCLKSCRYQTFQDFEVLVIENGDSDEAEPIVSAMNDSRFRYVKTDREGVGAARNVGTDLALGKYIVIHDDDDLMISTRLEDQLQAITSGVHGSYGGWIDFDHRTGEIIEMHAGKEVSRDALLFGGKVLLHPSVMLNKRVLRRFRYSERVQAGIDYPLIALLVRNGLRLAHTGNYGILRRVHEFNLTQTRSLEQKSAASDMANLLRGEVEESEKEARRTHGRNATIKECRNGIEARAELARWVQH
jgi:GT2 family glycosyltransferase